MSGDDEPLSYNEMWDDSMLVDSWNQALEEYKVSEEMPAAYEAYSTDPLQKYHSIHAKGIPLDEVSETPEEPVPQAQADQLVEEPTNTKQETEPQNVSSHGVSDQGGPTPREALAPAAAPSPHALLGSVQDEGLKRLLMSWYYAGYYTGLYEGQQQGKAPTS